MPTQNVNLPMHQARFVRQRVKSGRYQNASEVVRAGLRLLEQQEAEARIKLRTLRKITEESFSALDRGEYTEYSADSLNELFSRIDRKIAPRSRKTK